jgi:hypothetical protein
MTHEAKGSPVAIRHDRRKNMENSEPDDFAKLDDPSFLAERARLRGLLEDQPGDGTGYAELQQRYDAMTAEFCRRARITWTRTS